MNCALALGSVPAGTDYSAVTDLESLYASLVCRTAEMSVTAAKIEHMIETLAGTPGTPPPEPTDLTAAQLEAEICRLAGHIAAATCRLLDLTAPRGVLLYPRFSREGFGGYPWA